METNFGQNLKDFGHYFLNFGQNSFCCSSIETANIGRRGWEVLQMVQLNMRAQSFRIVQKNGCICKK